MGAALDTSAGESLRIDRLLFFLRFTKSRSLARKIVEKGHIRLNRRRIVNAAQPVRAGDVLTLAGRDGAKVVHIDSLPVRRGPASEASACYSEIVPGELPAADSQSGQIGL